MLIRCIRRLCIISATGSEKARMLFRRLRRHTTLDLQLEILITITRRVGEDIYVIQKRFI